MIQYDLMELYRVLNKGLELNTEPCDGECDDCKYRRVCTDLNNALFDASNHARGGSALKN